MNKNLIKQLYWVMPGVIIVFGLVLLFYHNYSEVTEPPEPNWSRALTIGKTEINKLPPIRETKDGNYIITRVDDQKLATTTINKEFTVKDEQNFDIPIDKWSQVYLQDDHIIYFDYTNIKDQNKNEIVSNVKEFYPLENTIFYIKGQTLYQLNPENKESTKVMDVNLDKQNIAFQQNENGSYILTSAVNSGKIIIQLKQLTNGNLNSLYQTAIKINPSKVVKGISFTINNQKLAILLQEALQSPQGPPEYFNYFMQTSLTGKSSPTLHELTFDDPAGNGELTEVSSVSLKYNNERPTLLFQANGETETQYNDGKAFNIYKTEIKENGQTITKRRSNTPAMSMKPQWVNNESIAWLDMDSDGSRINISSRDIAAISELTAFNSDDWVRALGKTLGMISSSVFAFAISALWFIWPVAFIAFMYIFKGKVMNHNPVWTFYSGIGIYAIAALAFRKSFFVNNIYINAPQYLTFNWSSFFYMILFAIVAFAITQLTKRYNGWDSSVRLVYFMGLHILLLTTFFGPYIV
ncbi:hypothetical protein [Virgibacillus sp. DJP39]|uniref:hypothetical protein n=1 Tax=Virgibacillus sp. DJP39 TaxID=3409790 RepID=UPI003BB56A39